MELPVHFWECGFTDAAARPDDSRMSLADHEVTGELCALRRQPFTIILTSQDWTCLAPYGRSSCQVADDFGSGGHSLFGQIDTCIDGRPHDGQIAKKSMTPQRSIFIHCAFDLRDLC